MREGGGGVPRKVSARVYRRRRIAAALAALLVLGLVMAAGGWGYTAFRFGQISSVHVPGLGKAPSDGSINLLVVGSDTRQGLRDGGFGEAAGQRSDVIILVHLVPAARHAAVLSIPRDLYVPVAGTGGSAKINSAFNRGPGQLVQTIQQGFGISIHHYLLVNFDGFREVVDALGGVAMYFPRPVRDSNNGRNESGLNVPRPGCHRLDGDQALALARSRYFQYQDTAGRWHADPGTDLGRIRRQQTMLRALAAKAIGRNLANPIRANALVGSVVRSLTKDDRLTIRRSVTLARQFRSFDPSRLTTITLPVDRAVQPRRGRHVLRPVRDSNDGRNESGLNVPKPGCQRLDGGQALALARSRYFQYQDKAGRWHGDPGTDLGRIRRQQTMLRALAAKAIGRNLANPIRANALVGSVVRSLTKDDRLTIRRSLALARQFRAFDPSRMSTITLPVERAVQSAGQLCWHAARRGTGLTASTPGSDFNSATRSGGAVTKRAFNSVDTDPVTLIFRLARLRVRSN